MNTTTKGYAQVISSYVMWGVLPIFWALFASTPPVIVLLHRVLWSMLLLATFLLMREKLQETLAALQRREIRRGLLLSSFCLGVNWLTYLWAISEGEYIASSMGYFICPLLTIASGAVFCREKLSPGQRLSVVCLLLGISVPIFMYGALPWIALVLAGSWSAYTLLRKRLAIGAYQGVFLETLLLLVPLTALACMDVGISALLSWGNTPDELLLFVAAGFVTAVPQIMLVSGAKFVPLKVVGVTQYIAPTIMLFVSLVYFHQVPKDSDLLSMAIVWSGIMLFFTGDYFLTFGKQAVRRFSLLGSHSLRQAPVKQRH